MSYRCECSYEPGVQRLQRPKLCVWTEVPGSKTEHCASIDIVVGSGLYPADGSDRPVQRRAGTWCRRSPAVRLGRSPISAGRRDLGCRAHSAAH